MGPSDALIPWSRPSLSFGFGSPPIEMTDQIAHHDVDEPRGIPGHAAPETDPARRFHANEPVRHSAPTGEVYVIQELGYGNTLIYEDELGFGGQ